MSGETWYHIGNWTLYGLITFGSLAMLTYGIRKKWFWVGAIGGCFTSVIAAEIVSFVIMKKSISTQYGLWLQDDPFWATLGLIFFSLAMICLVLHLVAYAFKKKPK